jgi:aspartate kinase
MALIVQKYGGTSVGDLEKIKFIAEKILAAKQQGDQVVVVVSAMAGETDKLEQLAYSLTERPDPREFDALLSVGEQVTIALLSMALISIGCDARSYAGHQIKILTDSVHTKARILDINKTNILNDLDNNMVVIVAGFQGVDEAGNITTLGRGGSDTTAVALAAALRADECQIYTDVDGVYTTDPKVARDAKKIDRITFEEMLELSSQGAKVLQIRAVEFAGRYNVPLRVLSTFDDGVGTLISYERNDMEHQAVSGVAFSRDEARIMIQGIKDLPGVAGEILDPLARANIEVDMLVQNMVYDGRTDFTFTVHRRDFKQAKELALKIAKDFSASNVLADSNIAKLSLIGVGMRANAGIASKMFKVLGSEGINIHLISTSEIKVSVLIDEKYIELGVRALHEAFGLGGAGDKNLGLHSNFEQKYVKLEI